MTVPLPPSLIGSPAPAFEADAFVAGEEAPRRLALSSLSGRWVVLVFYGQDFDPRSALDLHGFGRCQEELASAGAELVAAGTDSYLCHRAWLESHPLLGNVRYPVVADPSHRLAAAYGVLGDDGSARRATFVIDPAGVVAHAAVTQDAAPRHGAETLSALRALRRH